MKVFNIMEQFVKDEIYCLMAQKTYSGCTCEKCRADMMALALNKLPAKYVVTEKGKAISKVEVTIPQNRVDLIAAVTAASKIVAEKPRHEWGGFEKRAL